MDQHPRLATRDDVSVVEDVVKAAYAHYVSRIGRKPAPMLDDYGALIEQGRVYVLEHVGVVKGILVLIPEEHSMLLDNVAVVPEAQGSGLGRRLLEFAEHRAISQGYCWIRLYTNELMAENIALYSHIGYSETHRSDDKGFKRVYMSKRLG